MDGPTHETYDARETQDGGGPMKNTMTVIATTHDVVVSARPATSCTLSRNAATQHKVRVIAPVAAQVAGEKSAVGTDDFILTRSGHVPWSPPV